MKDLWILTEGESIPRVMPAGTLVIDGKVVCESRIPVPATTRVVFTDRGIVRFQTASKGQDVGITFGLAIEAGGRAIFENGTIDGQGRPRVKFEASSGQGPVLVDWWGAKGDADPSNAATNVLAIRAAFAALPTDAVDQNPVGTVRFRCGTYYIDETILLRGHLRLEGAGCGSPIDFEAEGHANVLALSNSPATSHPSWTHLCLLDEGGSIFRSEVVADGADSRVEVARIVFCYIPSGVRPTGDYSGILVNAGATLQVDDCGFLWFGRGIRTRGTERLTVRRCGFLGNRIGVHLERAKEAVFEDCRFGIDGPGTPPFTGIMAGSHQTDGSGTASMIWVRRCRFERVAENPVECVGVRTVSSRAVSLRECVFENLSEGVLFDDASLAGMGAEVRHCRFDGCTRSVDSGSVSHLVQVERRGGVATREAMNHPPSDAGWNKGDVIRNAEPAVGEPFGWVCVGHDTATSKPKWMAFGQIGY